MITDRAAFIREQTVVAKPPLCPELPLHLITEACPLWRAGERELEALGLPPPYWAFCWPGGQALARFLLDHPEEIRGARVLDFGAGGAVEGLAALRSGAASVLATDLDPFALEAMGLNAALHGLTLTPSGEDLLGQPLEGIDTVLCGDVCYDRAMAEATHAWARQLASSGIRVFISDPGRGFLPREGLVLRAEHDAPADGDVQGVLLRRTFVFEVAA